MIIAFYFYILTSVRYFVSIKKSKLFLILKRSNMDKNSIFYFGEPLKEEEESILNEISQKTWGCKAEGPAMGNFKTLEFLPLTNMKGSSPMILMGSLSFDKSIPFYQKIKESKNCTSVGFILRQGEKKEDFSTEKNKPDFFIDLENKQIIF